MQLRARIQTHRENRRKDTAKHTVTLNMKDVNEATQKAIILIPPKEITERC
jgi:hypothetical protein